MAISRKGFLGSLLGLGLATRFFEKALPALTEARQASSATPRQSRIAEMEVFPFTMQSKEVFRISLGTLTAQNVLVRLRTEDGLVGWGESSPFSAVTGDTQATNLAAAKLLEGIVKGEDPFNLARIVTAMDAATTGEPGIKAAVEMAIWDICGKLSNRPVRCLLGNYRDSFETDLTVYLDDPRIMAEKARSAVNRGFKCVKVKVGTTAAEDIERVRSVRESIGKEPRIRIDANQGWTANEAVRALKGIDPYDVEFCEQPVPYWDWEGLRFVRERSPIPIMADESVHNPHDAITAVRRDAVDTINIKLMKTGGILQAVWVARIADAADMKCMLGCMNETRVALTAAAHVVCSQRNALWADLDAFTEHNIDPVIGGMQLKDGIIHAPSTPGLGLDIDPAWLKTLRAA
ncbi:MAG TPA: dipeptide epimerase [Terriglobia bacterium]|nr:dipeptide epimerase [Terriglobia bacterium]